VTDWLADVPCLPPPGCVAVVKARAMCRMGPTDSGRRVRSLHTLTIRYVMSRDLPSYTTVLISRSQRAIFSLATSY